MNNYRSTIETLLLPAGIRINGINDFDIQVNDDRFYKTVLRRGSMGLGESYMEGWWDCLSLDAFLYRVLSLDLEKKIKNEFGFYWQTLKAKFFNLQSLNGAMEVAKRHYDIGNDLFEEMLDKRMMYSCAYWLKADSLDEAQEDKLELICRKLKLREGMDVLDIGCGWGGFAQYATEKYGVKVTGVTISGEQAKLARARCSGLPVDILLQDYRTLSGQYDRIVSIGMFEHVGYKNYAAFMNVVKSCLKADGLFLLHCIGSDESGVTTDPWINRYIFPNGMMPSLLQIAEAAEGHFKLQDWHNFGLYYDRTLMEWLKNFNGAWPGLRHSYGDRFYRMWEYYLCLSAASFRARRNNLWQIVFSRPAYDDIYKAER